MNPRLAAFQILFEVISNQQFSNKLLNQLKQKKQLSPADLGFVFKLVYGTLQYKIYLEYVVNKIIDISKTELSTQIILWMSLYQIKFLKTPDHSVTFEMVEICKKINPDASGFVNVKVKELLNAELLNVDIKNNQNKKPLANGFPFWLYQNFKKDFGQEIADQIIETSNSITQISFRINLNKITKTEFLSKYQDQFNFTQSTIAQNCFLTSSDFLNSDALKNGFIFIQDETSILASEILDPKPGTKVLDMCCAPGGKLTHLSQLVGPKTKVLGNELDKSKQNILQQNILQAGSSNITLQFGPGQNIEGEFDYIMLDAPCSGWGVLKRKPEIKLKKRSSTEMEELYNTQKDLLQNAIRILKTNGKLVYATCTINKQENQNLIEKTLTNYPNLDLVYEKQFFGFEGNNNGFYIACLKKVK